MPQPEHVQERLKSLENIDHTLVATLQHASLAVGSLADLKRGHEEARQQLKHHVLEFYTQLESATVQLRREIKLLDDNTGTTLLPVSLTKKATGQDDDKLSEQFALLEDLTK